VQSGESLGEVRPLRLEIVGIRARNPRTTIDREAARTAARLRRDLGDTVRTMREDAGLSIGRLAAICGLSKSHVHDIEGARVDASSEALARVATALGGTLASRIYPGTGPLVRDHLQAAMLGALLGDLDATWRPVPEVGVSRPVRGVIDLVLERSDPPTVACEAQSDLRRLEQQVRWSRAKADALADARGTEVSPLLLLRSTARTRAIAREYGLVLEAAYPARHVDALAALRGGAAWPGAAIVWCRVDRGGAILLPHPPRGVRPGR
jgi:transcriptional regulator with XRE-family HTH domain